MVLVAMATQGADGASAMAKISKKCWPWVIAAAALIGFVLWMVS